MKWEKNLSDGPTIGVEVELQLIDPISRNLTSYALNILDICKKKQLVRIKKEIHQSMLEIDTPVCKSVKECRKSLYDTLLQLTKITADLNIKYAISGTHPFQKWTDRRFYPAERYLFLYRKYRWLAKRINVYGLHVHIGVSSGDSAIQISNRMIKYLPYLLALSSSSPYWGGSNTGLSSCRVGLMQCFPFSGIPDYFSSWAEFSEYVEILRQTKAISSLKDLYWHIRPNPGFGTLEFRICDGMPTLTETMALVAFIQCLVEWMVRDPSNAHVESDRFHRLVAPENLWRAARDGLKAVLIGDSHGNCRPIATDIYALVEQIAPIARELDCLEELMGIHQIIQNGSSADRQRKVFKKTKSHISIVDSIIEEMHADMVNSPLQLEV